MDSFFLRCQEALERVPGEQGGSSCPARGCPRSGLRARIAQLPHDVRRRMKPAGLPRARNAGPLPASPAAFRMVGQTGEIEVPARRLLSRARRSAEARARAWGSTSSRRAAELVSKRDGLRRRGEHPRAHAGVDVFRIRFCLEQPELGLRTPPR